MKPLHEETLRAVQIHGDGRHAIVASDGRMVAETRALDGAHIARGLAAMPLLARALLAHLENGHTKDCANGKQQAGAMFRGGPVYLCSKRCGDTREALHAAGAMGPVR